ncbi:MAG: MBOAT family O-acyltransferase [Bacteroidota bacterium]
MLFASGFFLVYFLPLLIVAYWLVPKYLRNSLLLLASIAFYAWGEPVFVFLMLGLTLINFAVVRRMDSAVQRKTWLVIYLIINLGFLAVFKYGYFFIGNLQQALGMHLLDIPKKITLPLGISFYAFHAITYGVDVYRRKFTALRNIETFSLYLFLFPHQIAGPIVNYQSIAAELKTRLFNADQLLKGMYRFTVGLAKKVLLSNGLILLLEAINTQQALHDSATLAWLEAIVYAFHIYFDFSGYSDMAIGLGQVFGFHFPENFDKPYTARSITEFWQRWHKSLGYFMKHYLYIPLGGNKGTVQRTYINLVIVFFLSGLWHGAAWNFIFWGLFHGCWLVIERLFLGKILQKISVLAVFWTFFVVINGWVLFHENSLSDALHAFQTMWSFDFEALPIVRDFTYFAILLFSCVVLIVLENISVANRLAVAWRTTETAAMQYICFGWMALLYVCCFAYIIAGSYSPFIYFNF